MRSSAPRRYLLRLVACASALAALACTTRASTVHAAEEEPDEEAQVDVEPSLGRPQGTAGLTIGAAGVAVDNEYWNDTVFHLGAYGDVLFGRAGNDDFGFGPYAELLTNAFDDFQLGLGGTLLLPVLDTFPIAISVGPYGRLAEGVGGIEPGIATTLFWGTRSYNYHSDYIMSAGIHSQLRVGLGDAGETAIVVAARLDFVAMSLPFLYLFNAMSGGSPDTDAIARRAVR